jgi:hypothetical protein
MFSRLSKRIPTLQQAAVAVLTGSLNNNSNIKKKKKKQRIKKERLFP